MLFVNGAGPGTGRWTAGALELNRMIFDSFSKNLQLRLLIKVWSFIVVVSIGINKKFCRFVCVIMSFVLFNNNCGTSLSALIYPADEYEGLWIKVVVVAVKQSEAFSFSASVQKPGRRRQIFVE
ncbi:hypothetical protein QUC31_018793 [Theobroma cacao]